MERQRLGRYHQRASSRMPAGAMRAESYSGRGVVILNALSATGFTRWFSTSCEGVGKVEGLSVQYPWRSLRGAGFQLETEFGVVGIVQERRTFVTVGCEGGAGHLGVRSISVANDVVVEAAGGAVVGRFPAWNSWIEVDFAEMSETERLLFLVVLGAGVVRRARRFGLMARAWLPSAID